MRSMSDLQRTESVSSVSVPVGYSIWDPIPCKPQCWTVVLVCGRERKALSLLEVQRCDGHVLLDHPVGNHRPRTLFWEGFLSNERVTRSGWIARYREKSSGCISLDDPLDCLLLLVTTFCGQLLVIAFKEGRWNNHGALVGVRNIHV